VIASIEVKGGAEMWNFKKCSRSRGDVYIEEDPDRCFEKCLQCGYERELERVAVSRFDKSDKEDSQVL